MFTGLVEDIGTVERVDRRSDAAVLAIAPAAFAADALAIGDSIAVDGVCLTVAAHRGRQFEVLAGAETLRRTNLAALRVKSKVNLERALRVGDRLGGHMVSGHVDAVGRIASRRDLGSNVEISVEVPPPNETSGASARGLLRYVVDKGSIAIDGISLTVNRVDDRGFAVALIPHTASATTLARKSVGDRVNLEVDPIAKYVEKLLEGYRA